MTSHMASTDSDITVITTNNENKAFGTCRVNYQSWLCCYL